MAEVNRNETFPNAAANQIASCIAFGPYPPKSITITLYSVSMPLSLIGNLSVIAVFYRNKTLRTAVHYFIVNMAISDLIVAVIHLPWLISDSCHDGLWLVDGVLGKVLCKLVWFTWGLSTFVSILSMLGIAVDRHHAVLFPMKSALFSRTKCGLIITAIWVASVAFWAHFLYGAEVVSKGTGLVCIFQWEPTSYSGEVFRISWILHFCLTLVSATVLTFLYSSIIIFLFREKNNLHLASEIIKLRAKENRQIIRMLVTIVVAFYVVWTPFHVTYGISILIPTVKIPCLYILFCVRIPLLYAVVNPVVYYIFNSNYRQGFRELLYCPWSCFNNCNDCFHPSIAPQGENNVHNAEQVNDAMENIELQEHR